MTYRWDQSTMVSAALSQPYNSGFGPGGLIERLEANADTVWTSGESTRLAEQEGGQDHFHHASHSFMYPYRPEPTGGIYSLAPPHSPSGFSDDDYVATSSGPGGLGKDGSDGLYDLSTLTGPLQSPPPWAESASSWEDRSGGPSPLAGSNSYFDSYDPYDMGLGARSSPELSPYCLSPISTSYDRPRSPNSPMSPPSSGNSPLTSSGFWASSYSDSPISPPYSTAASSASDTTPLTGIKDTDLGLTGFDPNENYTTTGARGWLKSMGEKVSTLYSRFTASKASYSRSPW